MGRRPLGIRLALQVLLAGDHTEPVRVVQMASQPLHNPAPRMETLFLCRDDKTLAVFSPLLQSTGTGTQVCSDPDLAVEMLARWRFDAVILDCDEVPKGLDVLRSLRAAPSNRSTVAFALVDHTPVGFAFRMGATFVLNKPVAKDRARCALQAAFSLMLLRKRRYHRRPISVPATFVRASGGELKVQTVNISEGGACISGTILPAPGEEGTVLFELPGRSTSIVAASEIVWSKEGRAGLCFDSVLNGGLNTLREWINESFQEESAPAPMKQFARVHLA